MKLTERRGMHIEPVLFFSVAVLMTGALAASSTPPPPPRITIIAGAESHGMLDACDCEYEPGGGMAKRMALLESLGDREKVLLLDAGGFSAGGIYDDYSEGRRSDSVRSATMIAAMGIMRYDAVAIGDDDLQYGGTWLLERAREASLPLVSSNCFTAKKKRIAAPYIIVRKSGITFGITAVCTPEKLFPVGPHIQVTDPAAALREIWKPMTEQSEVQIILSHLGQEESAALAGAFPGCDLIVNGHRKSDSNPVTMIGKVPLMQFGFQGKSLSGIVVTRTAKELRFERGRWFDINLELPDDPRMTESLKKRTSPLISENSYDLYIMSQCPYGLEALGDVLLFAGKNRSVQWNLWFIGTAEGDTVFSSLHGKDEVRDEKAWLAIRKLYPGRWIEFLRERAVSNEPTKRLMEKLGFNVNEINGWAARDGNVELQKHYYRSMRLSISASPTLLVNNRPFGRNITYINLQRFQCSFKQTADPRCDSLPQCGENADCRAPGKLGACVAGKCTYRDAVPFTFTALIADSTLERPEKKVIRTTMDLFPGADIQVITLQGKRGIRLLKQYKPDVLPLYIFGREVKLAHNFSTIRSGLVERNGTLTFKKGIVDGNYHLKRKKRPGMLTLFIDPFFQELPAIFTMLDSDSLLKKRLAVEPVFYMDPAAARPGTEERFRQEEAMRWIIIGKFSNKAQRTYLAAYARQPGSSYWQALLRDTGIPFDSVQAAVTHLQKSLDDHWNTIESLEIREPVVLLIDNVETVPINGERELRRILAKRIR
ncbi:MAG: hypothetical protein JW913_15045 [Chitinispirillaceae bacterium]|nr:hypothetical protein [Chitinispirillaceae bacterium]